jgi:hypothetical protein
MITLRIFARQGNDQPYPGAATSPLRLMPAGAPPIRELQCANTGEEELQAQSAATTKSIGAVPGRRRARAGTERVGLR